VVDVGLLETGIGDGGFERLLDPLEKIGGDLLELRPGEGLFEVERAFRRGGDEGQVDRGALGLGELVLGLFVRLLQMLSLLHPSRCPPSSAPSHLPLDSRLPPTHLTP